jgi:hypothetical protein
MSLFSSVLTQEDIVYLNNLPEVLEAKARLSTAPIQYFKVALTETIRAALSERFGVNVSNVSHIPMRWIKGDTAPHIDTGLSNFENTYLVYLTSSEGSFTLEDTSYPITENTGFVFSEGLEHMTQGTGSVPRLLLGPMNEFAEPVGGAVGQVCFLEGTQILCKDGNVRIEELKCGDLVKTLNGYKAIVGIKKDTLVNPGTNERTVNRLYSYDDKLFVTGAHSVLVDSLTQKQKENTAKHLGLVFTEEVEKLFVAESKCKLMAYLDDKATPWASEGKYTIWHIALENADKNANYGIYANGYLVESCSINTLG